MTPDQYLQLVKELGLSGFTMLLLWLVYKDCSGRLDKKDEAFRALEREVRTEITTQLIASTSAMEQNARVMERVIDKLSK